MSTVNDTSASGASVPSDELSKYAGLADWVYHRDSADQGFSLGELGYAGTFQAPSNLLSNYGLVASAQDGFIYNPATGFTAAVVRDGAGYAVVFRGTDLNATDLATLLRALTPGSGSGPDADALDVQADNRLGRGTMPSGTQAQDVLNLMDMLKTALGSLSNVTVLGQSLGGGLAGLASAVYGVKGVLIDPAPFATELRYIAAARALQQTSDGKGGFLSAPGGYDPSTVSDEVFENYNYAIWQQYTANYNANLSQYSSNIGASQAYLIKDELLTYSTALSIMGIAGAQSFHPPQPNFDAGEAKTVYEALALHNPSFFALAARSAALGSEKSFANLLKNNAFLRDIFVGEMPGIAGAISHARSDDGSIPTTSRVGGGGPNPSILERALYKSIGSETDLYAAFQRLFGETIMKGAASQGRTGQPTQPSLYAGISKLALGVTRDVVSSTSSIDDIGQKISKIDLNFAGEQKTNFSKSDGQTKVIVNVEDIKATEKDYQGKDGLAHGVYEINRIAWDALIKNSSAQVVEKALGITSNEVFGSNAKGLPWKVVVVQAGSDQAPLDYSGSSGNSKASLQNQIIFGGKGADKITGTSKDDIILGGVGADKLFGGKGKDILVGEVGKDILDGGAGDSIYHGGEGDDIFVIDGKADKITIIGADNADRLYVRASAIRSSNTPNISQTKYDLSLLAKGIPILGGIAPYQGKENWVWGTYRSELTFPDDHTFVLRYKATIQGGVGGQTMHIEIEDVGKVGHTVTVEILGWKPGQVGMKAEPFSGTFQTTKPAVSNNFQYGDLPKSDNMQTGGDGGSDLQRMASHSLASDGDATAAAVAVRSLGDDTLVGTDDDDYQFGAGGSDLLLGNAGDDEQQGGLGDDILVGGAGADVQDGGEGSDTYRYVVGDGNDVIGDTGIDGQEIDVLELLGITADRVLVSFENGDLLVTLVDTGETIRVEGQFDSVVSGYGSDGAGVEEIVFADGTVWDRSEIEARSGVFAPTFSTTGTAGADNLTGDFGDNYMSGLSGDDVILGLQGNDRIIGGAGVDRMYGGDGFDFFVAENFDGDDLIDGGAGIDSMDYSGLTYGVQVDLTLGTATGFAIGNDTITGIEVVYGTSAGDVLTGSAAAEELYGYGGNDEIRGGAGNDRLDGSLGSDTYRFARGDGTDTISEYGSDGDVDVVRFDAGISRADISFQRAPGGSNTVVMSIAGGQNEILLEGQLAGPQQGIEQFVFADGTVLTAAELKATLLAAAPTAGDDTIFGTAAADVLTGGAGNDALFGSTGDDVYLYARGQGSDVIEDSANVATENTLRFTDLNAADLTFGHETSGDLAIRVAGTGETIVVRQQFVDAGYSYLGVGRIEFANGVAWDRDTIAASSGAISDNAQPTATGFSVSAVEDTPLRISISDLLAHAADADGDRLEITQVFDASEGTATIDPDGYVTFRPDPEFSGQARFSFEVSDGRGGAATTEVLIDVASRNDAPIASAAAETASGLNDAAIVGQLLEATDADFDALQYKLVAGSEVGGTVTVYPGGTYVFTPTSNFTGSASFSYYVDDGVARSSPKAVSLTVQSSGTTNHAPDIAASASLQVIEDQAASGRVVATDVDGDALTYALKQGAGPAKGSVSFGTAGAYTYTPGADANGSDTFTVAVSDGRGGMGEQVVTVAIAAVNDAPTASASMFLLATEDTAVSGRNVASDVDGDALAYAVKSGAGPTKGSVSFGTAGAFTYTPTANANGTDTFTVAISDGKGGLVEQTVTVAIAAVNDAPTAAATSTLQATEDTAASGTIVAADVDGDALAYAVKSGAGPTKGSVAIGTGGAYTYTPTANANGTDAFTVAISDGKGGIVEQTVSVSIADVNDAPTAAATSTLQATEDTAATGTIVAADVDGDALAYAVKSGASPTKGTVSFGANGAYTYTLASNANGADAFTVAISDGKGGLVEQVVSVSIAAVNDAPTAVADTGSAGENEVKTFDVLANDTDVDVGDTRSLVSFTVRSVDGVPGGLSTTSAQSAFSIQAGKLAFAPGTQFDPLASGQSATVVVDYVIQDAAGARSSSSLTLAVVGADEATAGGTSGADTLYGTSGADTIHGLAGNDVIWGRDGNDLLYGDGDNDQLNGESGNDLLDGGTGDDAMAGGVGDDIYYVDSAADTVTEASAAGTDEVRTTLSSYTLGSNVENLAYIGTAAFTGTGNALANVLTGGVGADKLTGGAGNDVYRGLGGDDFFYGGAGADSHDGGDGFDTVEYSAATAAIVVDLLTPSNNTGDAAGDTFAFIEQWGLSAFNDRFVGGAGVDYVYAQGGNDTLLGSGGDDWLAGGAGADGLDGGDGFDTADYTGASAAVTVDRVTAANSVGDAKGDTFTSIERFHLSQYADRFVGSSASEYIYGNGGSDTLIGNDGDDWLIGGAGADALTGGNGYDTASYFSSGAAVIIDRVTVANSSGEAAGDTFTTIEAFQLTAGYADRFVGSSVAETVFGGGGNDTLIGNGGNDFLDGEEQNDTLTGGAGIDTFAFYERAFGKDVVTDFTSGDLIEFSTSAFSSFAAVQAKTTQVGANTVITLDADDTVTLQNVTAANLKAADFHFV